MAKFEVEYEHEVIVTYRAIVEAETEEEAKLKVSDGAIESEQEIEHQGMRISISNCKKL